MFTLLLSSSLFSLRFHYLIIILKELPRTFLNPETQSLEYLSLDYFLFPHKIFIIKFNFYRNLFWFVYLQLISKNKCYWYGNQWYPPPEGEGGGGLKSPKEEIRSLEGKDGCYQVGSLEPSRWEIRRSRSKLWKSQHTSCQEGCNFGITPIIKEESHKHCKRG